MGWGAFLAAIAGPIAVRALIYLGFGLFSFAAVATAFNVLITLLQDRWAGLPAAVLQLASLAKVPQALGLVMGAYMARLTIWIKINGIKMLFKG
jgi:hypothetical protein